MRKGIKIIGLCFLIGIIISVPLYSVINIFESAEAKTSSRTYTLDEIYPEQQETVGTFFIIQGMTCMRTKAEFHTSKFPDGVWIDIGVSCDWSKFEYPENLKREIE